MAKLTVSFRILRTPLKMTHSDFGRLGTYLQQRQYIISPIFFESFEDLRGFCPVGACNSSKLPNTPPPNSDKALKCMVHYPFDCSSEADKSIDLLPHSTFNFAVCSLAQQLLLYGFEWNASLTNFSTQAFLETNTFWMRAQLTVFLNHFFIYPLFYINPVFTLHVSTCNIIAIQPRRNPHFYLVFVFLSSPFYPRCVFCHVDLVGTLVAGAGIQWLFPTARGTFSPPVSFPPDLSHKIHVDQE